MTAAPQADTSAKRAARPGDRVNARIDGTNDIRRCECISYPDTFFSTPARCSIQGRTVRGFLSLDGNDTYVFTPDTWKTPA